MKLLPAAAFLRTRRPRAGGLMIYLWPRAACASCPRSGRSPGPAAVPAAVPRRQRGPFALGLFAFGAERGLCQGFGSPSSNGPAGSPDGCVKPLLPLISAISCRSIHLFGKETQTGSAARTHHRHHGGVAAASKGSYFCLARSLGMSRSAWTAELNPSSRAALTSAAIPRPPARPPGRRPR